MSQSLHAVGCVARRTACTAAACLLLVAATAARAQPTVTVSGYDGTPLPMSQTPEISRDGRTLLFYAAGRLVDPALPDEQFLFVRRVDTGAVLFALPSPATPALQARLSPDGNHVVYRVGVSTGLAIVSRQLDTGVERPVHATVGRPVIDIVDVSDNASHIVIRETDLEPATRVLVKHGDSSVWLTAPCSATGVDAQADVDPDRMVSADGSTVAYQSHTGRSRLSRLYASALARTTDGEGECVRLDDPRVWRPGAVSLRGLDEGQRASGLAEVFVVDRVTPAYVDPDTSGVPFTEFSMIVESPVPLVAERRMTWDWVTGYGSHADSGVTAPATTWHFAEGASIAGLETFFLLQNPTSTAATVTMRYLLAGGAQAERTHIVPAQSRLTVWANQESAPVDAAEFATSVTSDMPIVAERALWRACADLV